MKVACILSLAIGFAMLIPGTGYAVASNPRRNRKTPATSLM